MSVLTPNIPPKAVNYLIYGAKEFDAQRALSLGLVTDVFPRDHFLNDTTQFIRKLAERPRVVLESIKRFQGKAAGLTPEMRAEYAVAVRALAGTRSS